MKLSKVMKQPISGAYCCKECSAILHTTTTKVCLTCGSSNLKQAIKYDCYEADKKDTKFRRILGHPVIDEAERRANKRKKSLFFYKEWKKANCG